jgi:hypothetical protein
MSSQHSPQPIELNPETSRKKLGTPFNQGFMAVMLLLAALGLSAILSKFSGNIHFHLGANGVELKITGERQ